MKECRTAALHPDWSILLKSVVFFYSSDALLTTDDASPFYAAAAAVPHSFLGASGTSFTGFTSKTSSLVVASTVEKSTLGFSFTPATIPKCSHFSMS